MPLRLAGICNWRAKPSRKYQSSLARSIDITSRGGTDMAKQKREKSIAGAQSCLTDRDEELSERIIFYFLEEAWNKRNLAIIDELFTLEAVAHDPAVPVVTDVESIKQFIAAYLTAFPDLQVTVDDLFATEGKVAT